MAKEERHRGIVNMDGTGVCDHSSDFRIWAPVETYFTGQNDNLTPVTLHCVHNFWARICRVIQMHDEALVTDNEETIPWLHSREQKQGGRSVQEGHFIPSWHQLCKQLLSERSPPVYI